MIVVDRQVGVGRIDMESENLVEQIKLSRESDHPKESFEAIPKSL